MARIVELVGSPGVGKTTLYREMEYRWNKKRNWVPGEYLYPKEKSGSESPGTFILNVFRQITGRKQKVDTSAMKEAGERFVTLYPEYMDECWNNINCSQKKNLNGLDLRFQKISYLYRLTQKIQTLTEINSDKIAMVDEGLIHFLTSKLYYKEEEIENLLQIMPLPDAVISIETDLQENTKRLMQRKKVIPMHKLLIGSELEKITHIDHYKRVIVNRILETMDIPFLKIDSTHKIAGNVDKIMNFVESL